MNIIIKSSQNCMVDDRTQSQMVSEGLEFVEGNTNFIKQWLKAFWKFKISFFLEFVRLCVYLGLAICIFGVFYSRNKHQMENYSFFSGDQVVNTPEIKGLFPPVKGLPLNIEGRWRVSYVNSLEIENNHDFGIYILEFKSFSTHKLRVKKQKCNGDYMMIWDIHSHNMHIRDFQNIHKTDDMVITANQTDTQCIKKDQKFFDYIKNVSVWAIQSDRLFLLVEKWIDSKIVESVLILERTNK